MRKTSQDGGDSTSITSGIENEMKKSGPGILKSTKNSIKRKVQHFSNESDDTANEPLLHNNKEKSEIEKQSAKFLMSKTKTDFASGKGDEKDKLLADDKITKPSITDIPGITDAPIGNGVKDQNMVLASHSILNASIHNHMNTNVFHSPDALKTTAIAKTQIVVEIDTSKPTRYSPSPFIFTTAKIHTDGKIQQMEPVQVTPVPIISTIEGGLVKTGTKAKEFGSKQTKENQDIAVTSPATRVATISKLPEKHDITVISNEDVSNNTSIKPLPFGNKGLTTDNKKISGPTQNGSDVISSKAAAQISNSKASIAHSLRTKIPEPLSKDNVGAKLIGTPIRAQDLQHVSCSQDFSSSVKKEFTKIPAPIQTTFTAERSNVDINKNFHQQPKLDSKEKTVSSTEGINSDPDAKEDKTLLVSNKRDSMFIYNNQDSKMTTSKIQTPVKEQPEYISTTVSAAKLSPAAHSGIDKGNTVKSTESSVYKKDSSLLAESTPITTNSSITKLSIKDETENVVKGEVITKPPTQEALSSNKLKITKLKEGNVSKTTSLRATSTANTTQSSVNKLSDKEHVINNVKTLNSTKPIETPSTNKVESLKSPGSRISITEYSLPAEALPSTYKSNGKDKESSALASKTTSKETTAEKRLASDTNIASNVSNASITTASSTKSAVTVSPQTTQNLKTAPIVNKTPSIPNNTKITTSPLATSVNKTSVSSNVSTTTGITKSKTSSIIKITADDIGNNYKSNNVATVVSSISKPTTTALNSKSTLPSSSMTTSKTPSSIKQSTSPSTVKTISSIPTVKSSIASTVPHDKKATKGASTTVNEPMSSVSNITSSSGTTKKTLNTKDANTVKVTPSAKVGDTYSTKLVGKSSTQSEVKPREDVKDSKGSKA